MPLKAVLFDLWETLILDRHDRSGPRRAWRTEAVQGVLMSHGFEVELGKVSTALDAASVALTQLHDDGHDLDAAGRAHLFLDALDAATGQAAPRTAALDLLEVIAAMPLELAPHLATHALETLRDLKTLGLSTAIVSNAGFTTAPNLRLLLDHYDLSRHFEVLVFSDELQIAKPDPRIFEAALNGLGLMSEECAFVGDNPHNDMLGAMKAGLYSVQIGTKARDGTTPHARIQALNELIPLLRSQALL